jgi:hypothetical protein
MQTSQGYIFRILQHFVITFCNFTHFNKFFTGIYFFGLDKKLVASCLFIVSAIGQPMMVNFRNPQSSICYQIEDYITYRVCYTPFTIQGVPTKFNRYVPDFYIASY